MIWLRLLTYTMIVSKGVARCIHCAEQKNKWCDVETKHITAWKCLFESLSNFKRVSCKKKKLKNNFLWCRSVVSNWRDCGNGICCKVWSDLIDTLCRMAFQIWFTSFNQSPLDEMAAILADDIFKLIFLNENDTISIQKLLKLVPMNPSGNKPALVQVMAWRWRGDKPLPKIMMTQFTDAYMRH